MRKTVRELSELLFELQVANDDYYATMDDDEFEEEFEEFFGATDSDEDDEDDEDEDPAGEFMFRAYVRQRDIGFDAYRDEIAAKVSAIDDPEDLHVLAASIESNSAPWQSLVIASHPLCDIVSARMIYWMAGPDTVHEQRSEEADGSGDHGEDWYGEAVDAIEERARTTGFPEGLDLGFVDGLEQEIDENPEENLGEVIEIYRLDHDEFLSECKPDLDYSVEPYSAIPESLR